MPKATIEAGEQISGNQTQFSTRRTDLQTHADKTQHEVGNYNKQVQNLCTNIS